MLKKKKDLKLFGETHLLPTINLKNSERIFSRLDQEKKVYVMIRNVSAWLKQDQLNPLEVRKCHKMFKSSF